MKKLILLVFLCVPAWSAATRVATFTCNATATSCTATFSGGYTTAGGELLVVAAQYHWANITSVADNATGGSSTYQAAVTSTAYVATWYGLNLKSGATTITVTKDSNSYMMLSGALYTGVSTTGLDKTAVQSTNTTSYNSGNTATTTQADELLIGTVQTQATDTPGWTPDSGWDTVVLYNSGTNTYTQLITQRIVSATGEYANSGTHTGNIDERSAILTFKLDATVKRQRRMLIQ